MRNFPNHRTSSGLRGLCTQSNGDRSTFQGGNRGPRQWSSSGLCRGLSGLATRIISVSVSFEADR